MISDSEFAQSLNRPRAQELAMIGAEMMMAAARGFGIKAPSSEALRLAALRRKCLGMVRLNESPWVTFRAMIDAGTVRLVKRPNKPPLLTFPKRPRGKY